MGDNFRSVVEKQVEAYLEPRIREVFRQSALAIFDRINRDDFKFESQTDNLRASMGIGVFKDGLLTDWVENPNIAAQPKTMRYKGTTYEIDGRQALEEALAAIDVKGMGKWVMVLVAAVPYALWVDLGEHNGIAGYKRGTGWWSEDIVPFITDSFRTNVKQLIG